MPSEFIGTEPIALSPPEVIVHVYTQTELLKIYISGGVLAVAILVITYYVYQWYSARYAAWVIRRDNEERISLGQIPTIEQEHAMPVKSVNTKIMFVVGAAVIIIGVVQLFF
jgi:hypothetical protein